MKRLLSPLAAILLASWTLTAPAPARADEAGDLMAEAARRFLGSLDDARRAKASFSFDDPERTNWHWIPRPRKGLPVKELTSDQRALAFALLNTGLSDKGMVTAATTMSYEEILRIEEAGKGPVRDPELYFISVFGTPGDSGTWGWRWEGHHLALNFTLRDGKVVSATPFMFGSNPAKVASGPNKGLRNLAAIQDPIYALVASLDEDQRKAAVISQDVPDVTSTPNSARITSPQAVGLPSDKLTDKQRSLLNDAIGGYLANFPEAVRDDLHKKLAAGGGKFQFAWYGPADPSKPHAFRIQGPTVYIDFNDKQNGANHIHTFYRNVDGDFALSSGN